MGGHSHWATTKRHKAAVDAKRGKIFTKIIREITIAARLGGGDPEGNPRLRLAIAKAKDVNMPSDNIKKAIQRGTGELPGVHFEEFQLEGYGPGGCALLIDLTSDNRNRTVAEIRNIFSKQNCNLAEAGAVAWQFHKKGLLVVEKGKVDEDKLMSLALDAGAEDMKADEKAYEVITAPLSTNPSPSSSIPTSARTPSSCMASSRSARRTRSCSCWGCPASGPSCR